MYTYTFITRAEQKKDPLSISTMLVISESLVSKSVMTAKASVSIKARRRRYFLGVLTWHPKTRFPYTINSSTIFSNNNTISPISHAFIFKSFGFFWMFFRGFGICWEFLGFHQLFGRRRGCSAAAKRCRFSCGKCRINPEI